MLILMEFIANLCQGKLNINCCIDIINNYVYNYIFILQVLINNNYYIIMYIIKI